MSKEEEKYIKIKELSKGSYGIAYLVKRQIKQDFCVIKTMLLENLSDDEKKESYKEAKILKSLSHPNITKFIEVFRESKPKYTLNIVMEYADGGDLFSKIKAQIDKKKLFDENQILDWFTQICLALNYIHKKKILHRDIKTKNIFLTKNGLIKLGDFGIAKCLSCTMDVAKTIIGTPYYLSPEIVSSQPYSFKSDIWSLGVILYELCALKVPFDAESLEKLSKKIITADYSPISNKYSKDLKDLIDKMLNPFPFKRPSVEQILANKIIKKRIYSFLKEIEAIDNSVCDVKDKNVKNADNNVSVLLEKNDNQIDSENKLKEFIKSKGINFMAPTNPSCDSNDKIVNENLNKTKEDDKDKDDLKNTFIMINEMIKINKEIKVEEDITITTIQETEKDKKEDTYEIKTSNTKADLQYYPQIDEPSILQNSIEDDPIKLENFYKNLIGKRLFCAIKEVIYSHTPDDYYYYDESVLKTILREELLEFKDDKVEEGMKYIKDIYSKFVFKEKEKRYKMTVLNFK